MNKNIRINDEKHIKYLGGGVLFKSKLEQMEIAYNNNEKGIYQEMNSVRIQTKNTTDKT